MQKFRDKVLDVVGAKSPWDLLKNNTLLRIMFDGNYG